MIDLCNTNNGNVVRIISDHQSIPEREASYATLSYCWGGDQFMKTTKTTLGEYQVGIDIFPRPDVARCDNSRSFAWNTILVG